MHQTNILYHFVDLNQSQRQTTGQIITDILTLQNTAETQRSHSCNIFCHKSTLFKEHAHIRLSRSTYKVTTFIEFKLYINSFRKFQTYLETFLTDLTDSQRLSAFRLLLTNKLTSIAQDLVTKIITEHKCETQTPEEACSGNAIRFGGR